MLSGSTNFGNLFELIKPEDIPYEEDVLRNPLHVKSWIRYYEFKQDSTHNERVFILSRAVKELPRSYKLWKLLLELLMSRLLISEPDENHKREISTDFPPNHSEWALINGYFERSLILCNRFPRIWYLFCQFLMHQPTRTTYTRRTFDRALKALPVTQHKDLWELYTKFAINAGGETTIRVWRRFVRMQPGHAERFCNILLELNPPRTAEAARVLTAILESPEKYANPMGKTTFEYWSLLCKIIVEHPQGIQMPQEDHLVPMHEFSMVQRTDSLDVEKILRTGLKMFKDQVGVLWNSLARWYILQGDFDRAQAIYEEAIRKVRTVKDFSLVFDAYAQMEESVLNDAMEKLGLYEGKELPEGYLDETDVDLRLARFERLMERRPFLVNEVVLRQNPHNVNEWKARVKLFLDSKIEEKIPEIYGKGVEAVNPFQAVGNVKDLWIDFAKFFNERSRFEEARQVFEKAILAKYAHVDDLAFVWCQWAEMEIENGNYEYARDLIGRATAPTSSKIDIRYDDDSKSPQQRLFKCIRLWSFYADLEESTGTVESAKAVYDRILELKIATPQIIINYASFLEENNYFEESFRAYERGVELFGYPIAFEIWNLYLTKFVTRYQGTKLERARDLFENALENCPSKFAKPLMLMYAKLEEDHGLARHALKIYDRALSKVATQDLYDVFTVYIAKAASFFGIVSTREIYSKALEMLPDKFAREMAIKFATMETKLGEVDRARAIFGYGSQISDPRLYPDYWQSWHEFEVKFGNEDTYKEMLRIKRSVQAKFNLDINYLSTQILNARGIVVDQTNHDERPKVHGFVRAETTEPQPTQPATVFNPEEIEVVDEDDEEEEAQVEETKDIPEPQVPDTVFGSLVATAPETAPLGAKDRFKKKKN